MPLLSGQNEHALLHEIEELRQELSRLLDDNPQLLDSPQACALSARLDILILRYMRAKLEIDV